MVRDVCGGRKMGDLKIATSSNMISPVVRHYWLRAGSLMILLATTSF